MARSELQQRVLEEWFRLPESRRRDATDAVAFAFRLMQDQPQLLGDFKGVSHELILLWLAPYLASDQAANS